MNRSIAIVLMLVALACATEPVPVIPAPPELENARLRYQRAEDNAALVERAGPQLRLAGLALDRAEEALQRGASAEDVALLAYRAHRKLDLARWVAVRGAGEVDALAEHDAQAPAAPGELGAIRAELDARHVDAERGTGALVVTLGRQLLEGSDVRPLGKVLLDRVAEVLLSHRGLRVAVVGHMDDVGSVAYNQRVSQGRADAAASYLVLRGLEKGALSARGIGAVEPRVPNTSRAGRRLNRRVEILIEAPGS